MWHRYMHLTCMCHRYMYIKVYMHVTCTAYLGNTILVIACPWHDQSSENFIESRSTWYICESAVPTYNWSLSGCQAMEVIPAESMMERTFLKVGGPKVSTRAPSPVPRRMFPEGRSWMEFTPRL